VTSLFDFAETVAELQLLNLAHRKSWTKITV